MGAPNPPEPAGTGTPAPVGGGSEATDDDLPADSGLPAGGAEPAGGAQEDGAGLDGLAGDGVDDGAQDAGAGPAPPGPADEPMCEGSVRYTLARDSRPSAAAEAAYDRITAAMDTAIAYYNCHTNIDKQLRVSYEPSVPTADGNPNGSIRFGSTESMNHITAMHEISHTLGVGDGRWDTMLVAGIFPGEHATAQLREITGNPEDEVHGDQQHFWPYGLNYTHEAMSEQDLIDHCLMVAAIRKDLGYD